MSKNRIASHLFQMKKAGQEIARIEGELYSADELLSMYFGRLVEPAEGQMFVAHA